MWAYLFSKPRTDGLSDEVELKHAGQEFSKPTLDNPMAWVLREPLLIHLGKKRVWVLVKADLNDEQASILSDNDRLLTGTTKLLWWESIMSSDFQRTLIENEQEEPGFKVCKIDLGKVGDKEAAVLAMLVKSLPDGPDKAELLKVLAGQANSAVAELEELATLLKASRPVCNDGTNESALAFLAEKVNTLPDGPDKDRLLEALRQDAKKPEAKPDFSGFMAELETLVPLIKKVATSPALLVTLTKYLPDGPDKAELLTTLAGYQANAAMAELEDLEENHLASEDVSRETVLTALAALVKKIESVPDGWYKDRLLEILRRDAKKPSTSRVADKEAELLAIVIRNLPDGEDKDQLLELLARNASVPGNADLPGFMVDFEALLVRALRRVSPPPVVITARDIMMKMEMDRLEGVKKADLSEDLAYDNKETKH